MFTGIVEELGEITAVENLGDACRFRLRGPVVTAAGPSAEIQKGLDQRVHQVGRVEKSSGTTCEPLHITHPYGPRSAVAH